MGSVPDRRSKTISFPPITELRTRQQFFADLRSVWDTVKAQGNLPKLLKLQRANAFRTLGAFVLDWITIAVSVGLVYAVSLWFLPVSLLLIGSRHRALSNLVHDASHGNLIKDRRINDWVTNFLAAFPMLDTVKSYRRYHGLHHANLGSLTADPDAITHLRYGFNDLEPWTGTFLRNYTRLLLLKNAWIDSMGSGITDLSRKEKLQVGLWWLTVLSFLVAIGGPSLAFTFATLWIVARATAYHAIRLFAEFLDHTGLKATSVVDFSRFLPHSGIIAWLCHPHQDTFHLVHHLAPNIPHYHLKAASDLMEEVPKIQDAHHCDAYFILGKHLAIDCWTGTCSH